MPGTKRDRWASDDEDNNDAKKTVKQPKKKHSSKQQQQQQQQQQQHNLQDASTTADKSDYDPLTQGCRLVYDHYEQIGRISEGTYGIVWKARPRYDQASVVALKQIKFHDDAEFSLAALREIWVLLALNQHENIVSVKEMVVGNKLDQVYMVMEWMDADLSEVLKDNLALRQQPSALKSVIHQILCGIEYVHARWYIHRDIKPSNILVQKAAGRVVLADFGLARRYQEPAVAMTAGVVTLWYRAPEVLLGETRYGPALDMWSVGCVLAELLEGNPLLPGQGEIDQLYRTFELLGSPNETVWPGYKALPLANVLRIERKTNSSEASLATRFGSTGITSQRAVLEATGLDLLKALLMLDPGQRITAKQALAHPYFTSGVKAKRLTWE